MISSARYLDPLSVREQADYQGSTRINKTSELFHQNASTQSSSMAIPILSNNSNNDIMSYRIGTVGHDCQVQ